LAFVADGEQSPSSGIDFYAFYAPAVANDAQTTEGIAVDGQRVDTNIFVGRENKKLCMGRETERRVCVLSEEEENHEKWIKLKEEKA
jgi:hypothetical protein